MKSGASSLNPYAALYVPLSKRGAAAGNTKGSTKLKALNYDSDNVVYEHRLDNTSINCNAEFTKWKGSELDASPSHHLNGKPETLNYNQEFMDLAYLQMSFPGVSAESLSDVYFANRCDLEASIDMLDQLEIYPDDPSDKLPDTLDIGDVPGSSGPYVEFPPQGKAKASAPDSSTMSYNSCDDHELQTSQFST